MLRRLRLVGWVTAELLMTPIMRLLLLLLATQTITLIVGVRGKSGGVLALFRLLLLLTVACRWLSHLLVSVDLITPAEGAPTRALVTIEPLLLSLVGERFTFLGVLSRVAMWWNHGDNWATLLTSDEGTDQLLSSLVVIVRIRMSRATFTFLDWPTAWGRRLLDLMMGGSCWKKPVLLHSKESKLVDLIRCEDRLCVVGDLACSSTTSSSSITHQLLVGHDIFHDHFFVFFSDRLPQLVLILVDQLLDIHIEGLRWWMLLACTVRSRENRYGSYLIGFDTACRG